MLVIILLLLIAAGYGAVVWWKSLTPSPVSQNTSNMTYLALGDSVAAGLGLGDPKRMTGCGRTEGAYPQLLANRAGVKLTSLACSGATYTAGIEGPQTVEGAEVPAQLTGLPRDEPPAFISLTAGANDLRWTHILRSCYERLCGSPADTEWTDEGMARLDDSISSALQAIRTAYPRNTPKTLVTGYYTVLPSNDSDTCIELAGIDRPERLWWRQQEQKLNATIERAAKESGFATFIELDFAGHDSCTSEPWVQGLTAPAPFHPTAAGQAAIARSVQNALGN